MIGRTDHFRSKCYSKQLRGLRPRSKAKCAARSQYMSFGRGKFVKKTLKFLKLDEPACNVRQNILNSKPPCSSCAGWPERDRTRLSAHTPGCASPLSPDRMEARTATHSTHYTDPCSRSLVHDRSHDCLGREHRKDTAAEQVMLLQSGILYRSFTCRYADSATHSTSAA